VSALAITAALVAASACPAHAFELFGFKFFGSEDVSETESPDAQRYTVDVQVEGVDEAVADRIRTASLLYTERDERPPPSTAAFLSRTEAEYARMVGALYAEGYYGGSVAITVEGRDPAQLQPDVRLPDPAKVVISVDPGPRFAFGRVEITGRAPPATVPEDRVQNTPETLGLTPGAVARSGVVLQSERALVDEWRQQGYPKAGIAKRDAVANHPTSTLDVAIAAQPGRPAVYGPVTVTGTEDIDPGFTAYMTGIQPGAPYDPDDLVKAAQNLRRLQVFASQRIVEADAVTPEGTLPLDVQVAERLKRVVGAGGSYSTVDGLGVEGYWEHRNLFGKAERLRIEGRVAGISSIDPTDFSYSAAATFTKPGVLTPLTDLTASLSAQREVLDPYTDNTVRARIGLAHQFFEGLNGTVSANIEATSIEDAPVEGEFLIASLPAELIWDKRDNALDPTTGFTLTGRLEPFHEFQFGNTGLISEIEATGYYALDPNGRFVIATRAAVGSIAGVPEDEFPANRLFFLGGGGSVRGYGFRNIGPEIDGDVVGGRSYVEGSLELRAKVTDTIGIVPFIDAGNAFLGSTPDFSQDIRFGAGIGLRYQTGLGPIRVDAAVPLNPGPDDPDFAIYVGLGQAF
jgi:translocation and assembly module TamA